MILNMSIPHFLLIFSTWSIILVQSAKAPLSISAGLANSVCEQQKLFQENQQIQPSLIKRPSSNNSNVGACGWHKFGDCVVDTDSQSKFGKTCNYTTFEACVPRIVHGTIVSPNYKYPFMASLQINLKGGIRVTCGGTILTVVFILTAAHCVNDRVNENSVTVTVAEHDTSVNEGVEKISTSYQVIVHPDYKPRQLLNDIALVRVDPPMRMNERVQPVKLAISNYEAKGMATIVGWGWSEHKIPASFLQEATVPIITDWACQSFYEGVNLVTMSNICTYLPGFGTCKGDSGGPLLVKNEAGIILQVGITSWAGRADCGSKGNPSVFTEVAMYWQWMRKIVYPLIK